MLFTRWCEFFYAVHFARLFLFKDFIMQPENVNANFVLADKIARVVYAETFAKSLRVVEALTSMIFNQSKQNVESIIDIISDYKQFESLCDNSARHNLLDVDSNNREFQMCFRVAMRMLHGNLPDMCNRATKFHRDEFLPKWATARGYVADIDGLLFYQ